MLQYIKGRFSEASTVTKLAVASLLTLPGCNENKIAEQIEPSDDLSAQAFVSKDSDNNISKENEFVGKPNNAIELPDRKTIPDSFVEDSEVETSKDNTGVITPLAPEKEILTAPSMLSGLNMPSFLDLAKASATEVDSTSRIKEKRISYDDFFLKPIKLNLGNGAELIIGPDHPSEVVRNVFKKLNLFAVIHDAKNFQVLNFDLNARGSNVRALRNYQVEYVGDRPKNNFKFTWETTYPGSNEIFQVTENASRIIDYIPANLNDPGFIDLIAVEAGLLATQQMLYHSNAVGMFRNYRGSQGLLDTYQNFINKAEGRFYHNQYELDRFAGYFAYFKESLKQGRPENLEFRKSELKMLIDGIYLERDYNGVYKPARGEKGIDPFKLRQSIYAYKLLYYIADNPGMFDFGSNSNSEAFFKSDDLDVMFRAIFATEYGATLYASGGGKIKKGEDKRYCFSTNSGDATARQYANVNFFDSLGVRAFPDIIRVTNVDNKDSTDIILQYNIQKGMALQLPFSSKFVGLEVRDVNEGTAYLRITPYIREYRTSNRGVESIKVNDKLCSTQHAFEVCNLISYLFAHSETRDTELLRTFEESGIRLVERKGFESDNEVTLGLIKPMPVPHIIEPWDKTMSEITGEAGVSQADRWKPRD